MDPPIEQLTCNVELRQEQLPICTRPLCFCYLLQLDSTNEFLYHPTKEFEKCKHYIKHAYLHELKNSAYIFELYPSYKYSEGEIKHLNQLIEKRINELKERYAIDIIKELENLGNRVTGIFLSTIPHINKISCYDTIMKDTLQLVADYLYLTGETLPKSNGDNIIHAAGTIEHFGGNIGRVYQLKRSISTKNKIYKSIMKETIQFIANYLDLKSAQLPPANIKQLAYI
jgi:hypothetical protein